MKFWWQKALAISVAVLTLGMISPNHTIWETLLEEKDSPKSHAPKSSDAPEYSYEWQDISEYYYDSSYVLDSVRKSAQEQSFMKFGSRIGPVIEEDFQHQILPQIQTVIDTHLSVLSGEELRRLAVSERPSGEHSEKIFHIYDNSTKKDLIRFHVRTDRKPMEGYFFNFHYHLAQDGFQKHYTLGDIFWSKNTPPKWLT